MSPSPLFRGTQFRLRHRQIGSRVENTDPFPGTERLMASFEPSSVYTISRITSFTNPNNDNHQRGQQRGYETPSRK